MQNTSCRHGGRSTPSHLRLRTAAYRRHVVLFTTRNMCERMATIACSIHDRPPLSCKVKILLLAQKDYRPVGQHPLWLSFSTTQRNEFRRTPATLEEALVRQPLAYPVGSLDPEEQWPLFVSTPRLTGAIYLVKNIRLVSRCQERMSMAAIFGCKSCPRLLRVAGSSMAAVNPHHIFSRASLVCTRRPIPADPSLAHQLPHFATANATATASSR